MARAASLLLALVTLSLPSAALPGDPDTAGHAGTIQPGSFVAGFADVYPAVLAKGETLSITLSWDDATSALLQAYVIGPSAGATAESSVPGCNVAGTDPTGASPASFAYTATQAGTHRLVIAPVVVGVATAYTFDAATSGTGAVGDGKSNDEAFAVMPGPACGLA